MRKLIELALNNSRGVTVAMLSIVVLGALALWRVPMDILPVFKSPAVQVLTFYAGMPAESIASTVTLPMERMTGQAAGMRRQESRSIMGVSIVRNYFQNSVDPNGALTQINSLALGEIPALPPGTLPPVVLPYDPTGTVPVCLIAVDSASEGESVLYDVARFEVRNMVMNLPGANAPVVYGGKIRAVLAEVDPTKLEARGLSLRDVLTAIEKYNLFLPTGDISIGTRDFAIDSNSMYNDPRNMVDIPLRTRPGSVDFLGDVAKPRDTHLIQMSAVRVNGRREVYIPVYRQQGASTLDVVDSLKTALPGIQDRLSKPDVKLRMVMDQSVYVRQSIRSLAIEGVLGALLCSLVILIFLGEWRMTAIAVMAIPLAVTAALVGLYALNQTVNMMTLAGLALAIGPLVDTAIVCLENTHRHLGAGEKPHDAALDGASEVALPELAATCSTMLVLVPLAVMPGGGQFLFIPLVLAVALAMSVAYLLSRTFIPSRAANWLRPHPAEGQAEHAGWLGRVSAWLQAGIGAGFAWYQRQLEHVLQHRLLTVGSAAAALALVVVFLTPHVRREFFPETDAGAFEIYVRANTGTRLTETEKHVAEVEKLIRDTIGDDLDLIVSDLGVWADWSAAYTPNAGPMDAVVKVQLTDSRGHSAQTYAADLRDRIAKDPRFAAVEFAFNTGGTIRSALNEGQPTPIDIRIEGTDLNRSHAVAERVRRAVVQIDGVVDTRIMQRMDYPTYVVEVDRAMSRRLGLTQQEVMENVVAALKSSIQYNKKNFWFDPVTHNQYFVGVQYPEQDIQSLTTLLNVSVTSPTQAQPIPLSNLVRLRPTTMAAEVTHTNLQPTIDVTMNVVGRDLGHVADDIAAALDRIGKFQGNATWLPYDPDAKDQQPLAGTKLHLSGEYGHMQETFWNFGIGLSLAVVFIYFLMVVLLDSYLIPLVILMAVPVGLVGVVPMLYVTGTAINVQSLLGVIFMVGIVVSNTVLLVDFAQNLRIREKLSPTDAIRKAAGIRAKPVVMTALAALFSLIPMALALERGSEANAPLGRAVIGGLIAGLMATLVVVPALYSLLVRDTATRTQEDEANPRIAAPEPMN